MSWGMGNVGGGSGLGSAFAVIAVAYPVGSTCTCTKGPRVLRAKDTSGAYLFAIPEAGTWTVSCTNGTITVSRTVVIDRQYQAEYLELVYRFYIFKSGEGLASGINITAVTGSRYDIDSNNEYINFNLKSNDLAAYTTNAVDFTYYNTLIYDFDDTTGADRLNSSLAIVIANTQNINTSGYNTNTPALPTEAIAGHIERSGVSTPITSPFIVDISSISGLKYIHFYNFSYAVTCNNIWLE